MKSIYLDYAAATPLDPDILEAMKSYFTQEFYNPSASYGAARKIRGAVDDARAEVANILGSRPAEIIFTAGATEANNLAISGVMQAFPQGEILTAAIEHESVLEPASKYKYALIPVDRAGSIEFSTLEKMITPKTVLVSIGLVNNELGIIARLSEISRLIKTINQTRGRGGLPLYLHTDAAQAPSFLDLHVSRLGVDLMSLNGGKIYGPKQSGALFVKSKTKLKPIIVGGGQEFGLRSGTENVAGIIGFSKALSIAQSGRKNEVERLSSLRKLLIGRILETAPKAVINSSARQSSPHIISVTFPGHDNERLMIGLDERGVQVATGSACSAASGKASHVLAAIGLADGTARSTLRISLGKQTTEDDIKNATHILRQLFNYPITS